MQNYPGEEMLLVYDYDFRFGENFYICLTEEAKEWVLNVRDLREHLQTDFCTLNITVTLSSDPPPPLSLLASHNKLLVPVFRSPKRFVHS